MRGGRWRRENISAGRWSYGNDLDALVLERMRSDLDLLPPA
jgi:hypothetical protein